MRKGEDYMVNLIYSKVYLGLNYRLMNHFTVG